MRGPSPSGGSRSRVRGSSPSGGGRSRVRGSSPSGGHPSPVLGSSPFRWHPSRWGPSPLRWGLGVGGGRRRSAGRWGSRSRPGAELPSVGGLAGSRTPRKRLERGRSAGLVGVLAKVPRSRPLCGAEGASDGPRGTSCCAAGCGSGNKWPLEGLVRGASACGCPENGERPGGTAPRRRDGEAQPRGARPSAPPTARPARGRAAADRGCRAGSCPRSRCAASRAPAGAEPPGRRTRPARSARGESRARRRPRRPPG